MTETVTILPEGTSLRFRTPLGVPFLRAEGTTVLPEIPLSGVLPLAIPTAEVQLAQAAPVIVHPIERSQVLMEKDPLPLLP